MHDWHRTPVRGDPAATYVAWPPGRRRRRLLRRGLVVAVVLVVAAGLALIGWDMRRRGVPLDLPGLRWWLSLWRP